MSDETGEIPGGEVVSYETDNTEPLTVEEAAREIGEARAKALNPAESAKPATAEEELPDEGNAAADEDQPTGETQGDDPAEKPLLDLPRSWTKDRAEHWNKLDPDTQEFLLEQDRKASAEVRRVQNEAAEKLKGLTAKEQQAEQARLQYEAKLTSTVKIMEEALQADFGDIQSLTDVRKLQSEDPFRFQAWQVRQMELTHAKSEQLAAEQRQAQERIGKRNAYETAQTSRLKELVPEFDNAEKYAVAKTRVLAMLTDPDDLGLKDEQLSRWMADDIGHEILSSAGIQKLMTDGLKYRDIQKAPKAVASKPVPPVQRPGVRPAANSGAANQIQALEKQLSSASGDKAARISAEIWRLERKTASR